MIEKVTTKSPWPEEWKDRPELIHLVGHHSEWLGLELTQKLVVGIQDRITKYTTTIGKSAIVHGANAEDIRVDAARIYELEKLKKEIYDIKLFIESFAGTVGK